MDKIINSNWFKRYTDSIVNSAKKQKNKFYNKNISYRKGYIDATNDIIEWIKNCSDDLETENINNNDIIMPIG